MGIQIKGSNDTISAADGSMVLEGAALTFTNENITGISTMGSAVVTSTVGIGSEIPTGKLDIVNAAGVDLFTLKRTTGNTGTFKMLIGGADPGTIFDSTGISADFVFRPGGTEKVRFLSGGQVAIGTVTEGHADADELTVSGTRTGITIRSASNDYGNIFFSDATSGTAEYVGAVQYYHNDNTLRLKTNSNDRLILNKEGDVNITGVTTATGFYPTTAQTGRRNMFINGNMSIAQRGTSSSVGGYQTIDRFYTHWSGGNGTVSQQTLANGDEIEGSTHYLRMATGSGGSSDYTVMRCPLEDVRRFSGDITVSFWAKYVTNAPNGGLTLWWQTNYGSGGTTGGSTAMQIFNGSGLPSLTTSWAKYSLTFSDFPSLSGKTIGANNFAELLFGQGTNSGGTAWTLDITNIQVERGKSASAFEQISQQENLALCQRYFRRDGGEDYTGYGQGVINATAGGIWTMPLDPPMRIAPTITNDGNVRIYDGTTNANVTAWNTNRSTAKNFWIEPTTSSSSFVVGRAFLVGNNADPNGYVNLNAELPI